MNREGSLPRWSRIVGTTPWHGSCWMIVSGFWNFNRLYPFGHPVSRLTTALWRSNTCHSMLRTAGVFLLWTTGTPKILCMTYRLFLQCPKKSRGRCWHSFLYPSDLRHDIWKDFLATEKVKIASQNSLNFYERDWRTH